MTNTALNTYDEPETPEGFDHPEPPFEKPDLNQHNLELPSQDQIYQDIIEKLDEINIEDLE